ncbi:sulfate transporter family-domain-containing protein [Boletus reticuloceps]|uniref:Sulfate transporter family-domain-containing protein n=1 Tax=Boletus reticuloceps TaxID=495285 RepID=A0A8I2Z3S7_9AGAM|nr:sulfate transporter family-domain-containing protein [Boletus reticuloceps]
MSANFRPNDSAFNTISTTTSFSSFRDMVHAQERTPLLNRDDVEAGPAQYTANTSTAADAASTVVLEGAKRTKIRDTKFARRVRYYVPSTAWIPNYSFSLYVFVALSLLRHFSVWFSLGGDVLAGVSLAAMLIPQSVSYGTSLAKIGPTAGLFAASIPPMAYSLLGTSRQLNVAPEAALSLLVGQATTEYRRSYPNISPDKIGIAVATAIGVQVGLFAFLLGFLRLGFLDVVLSRALLRGFITAVAVVITVEQLTPMFGLTALEDQVRPATTLDKILFLVEYVWTHSHKLTTLISFGVLFILIFLRFFKESFKRTWWIYRLPEVLLVVVASTWVSDELHWDQHGVAILGSVPISTGKHFFKFPLGSHTYHFLRGTTSTAILITVIGFLDSIVAAKQNGDRFGHAISPNRELVALGAANLAGSFIPGTLPAFGSIVRSRINGDIGARTQLASLITAGLVLLSTFFLLPTLYFLPKCVLASIICLFVMSLFSEVPHDLVYYYKIGAWMDLAMMFITFTLSVIWNVEIGIVVSLIISLLLVVRRSSKTRMTVLGRVPGTDQWRPVTDVPDAEDIPGTLIVRIRESLDFGKPQLTFLVGRLRRFELYGAHHAHPSEEPRRQPPNVLVFHMADVDSCDASAVQIFHELLESYKTRGVRLYITHLRSGIREVFENAGIVRLLGADAFYDTLGDAIARIEARDD